jgi:quercetin 2,3-dioxygenase
MDRKEFIRKSLLGTGIVAASPLAAALAQNDVDELKPLDVVGFNHLPNPESKVMNNMVYHPANSRGTANHGWLQANFSFSFASYYNPDRMHFGVLRVMNDDIIAPGMGFGTHPHDNMEIITVPLRGALQHKDSMGNTSIIEHGEVQVMSAGTGIQHSEFNPYKDKEANTLQIWLFPNKKNVTPRYDQQKFEKAGRKNKFQQILSPNPNDEGVWIHQDAWFHLGEFEQGRVVDYKIRRAGNGVYAFLISGKAEINGQKMNPRDAVGVWNTESLKFTSLANNTEVLLLDVPMSLG